MREYLFRGKRADDKEWVEGDLIMVYNHDTSMPDEWIPAIKPLGKGLIEVLPETVGQYIWLKDKNNTKAFVGDIFIDAKGVKRTIMQNSGGFVTESNPTILN